MTWLQVIPYFPTVLTFGAVSVAFIDVDMGVAESIASNKWYILFFVLFVYWGAICVALRVYFLQLGGTVVFGLETNFGCLFQISTFVLSQIEHNFSLESGHSRNNV